MLILVVEHDFFITLRPDSTRRDVRPGPTLFVYYIQNITQEHMRTTSEKVQFCKYWNLLFFKVCTEEKKKKKKKKKRA